MKTRFAPSPTGLMHIGNLRAALFNYLYARKQQGIFVLRIEDTDQERSTPAFARTILEDLDWLGLTFQEGPVYQSERQALYDAYFESLIQMGHVYECFCSEEELAIQRKVQLATGKPPRYPGTCRQLTASARASKRAEGRLPALRFRVPQDQVVQFDDLIKGPQTFKSEDVGDFILRRGDGGASFMFSNLIDDALMGITHALRGDDHLTNTPRQLLIAMVLGLNPPQYGHFPTILGADHAPLSKRNGSRSIQALREEGFLPTALLNYLARLGHAYPTPNWHSMEELIQGFELSQVATSPAHFDEQHLHHWQKEAVSRLDREGFSAWCGSPTPLQAVVVQCIQPNVSRVEEARLWLDRLRPWKEDALKKLDLEALPNNVDAPFFETAHNLWKRTPQAPKSFFKAVQQDTKRHGRDLFLPLRIALTGASSGPELERWMQLLGAEEVERRLQFAKERCLSKEAHLE